ncbi:hypothetical protein [Hoyosella altamirensis]|uniref:hypothetical protein n=1 Tax=Hoyosella altamirensis TaxID=616997 RepID=UPI0007DB11C2|nr:hypothetical protein [Hoyosella altamirensis]
MSAPKKYRKKPVVIEAMQWDGSRASIVAICGWANDPAEDEATVEFNYCGADDVHDVTISTLEGYLHVSPGDYVIRGVQGEFYPCKPDIFAATYEEADA